ncbi:hypothetical protein CABS02_13382 [Colletotrichum abscissum]|uniref:Uncharacterized protein n=1 Tax=Colletotrichum abscissum TaxID=1671311 RepID=A0A9P9X391_9PEZI|nr:hypothetical protein CABS02_13382 [Colletotrichum abscissum]
MQTGKRCSKPNWQNLKDIQKEPGPGTIALLVDMHDAEGCVVYIQDQHNNLVGMVGKEDRGFTIIIPWKTGLRFMCSGNCKIALMTAIEEKS